MPPDRRTLREIYSAYEGMKAYQIDVGQWVLWYRFNQSATTSHPIYDTGPQRVWYSPISIPAIIGEYRRADQNFDDDGLYLIDQVHLIISYMAFLQSQIVDTDPTNLNHLNDRVAFDGRLFTVDTFQPRGRVASHFLTISVDVHEVAQEDLAEDLDTGMFDQYVIAS